VYILIINGPTISNKITHTITILANAKGKRVLLDKPFETEMNSLILLNPLRKNSNVINIEDMNINSIYIVLLKKYSKIVLLKKYSKILTFFKSTIYMTSTYSISFPIVDYGTFNGTFIVNNSTNIIESFYDNTNPNVNIVRTIVSTECAFTGNTYTEDPINLSCIIVNPATSVNPYTYMLLRITYNIMKIPPTLIQVYGYNDGTCSLTSGVNTTYTINYIPEPTPTPPNPTPSNRFGLKQICCSIYSDNALVYYKPHSLATAGSGTVKNSRKKARKT